MVGVKPWFTEKVSFCEGALGQGKAGPGTSGA